MTQTFECENCTYKGTEVWYDDDFGGGLCNHCIATKAIWLNIPEPKKATKLQELYAKRNKHIVWMWEQNLDRQFIADTWGISKKQVRKIVNRQQKEA